MAKKRALDLFCGGGGAAEGLMAAGFDVVGVDVNPRNGPNYPGEFICGDATNPPFDLADFDFVWASPPCQLFSTMTPENGRHKNPNLMEAIRQLLLTHPWTCIENVPQAPMRPDLILTGPTVGLPYIMRKRHFELSFAMPQPRIKTWELSDQLALRTMTVLTSSPPPRESKQRKAAGLHYRPSVEETKAAMGITHEMMRRQIGESVAPPMAEYIARHAILMMDEGFNGRLF